MSDQPPATSAHAETQKSSSAREQSSPNKPVPASRWSAASHWAAYAALAIAVIAVVLAALPYFHPMHKSASTPQQGGDAKANVCSAFAATQKAVVVNTHMQSRNPNDATAELAVATNARLALIGGGAYLRDRLDANTAAPADLANAANSLANTIEQLGINYLTGAGPVAQDSLRNDLNSQITQLAKMCE
jgi:hypothetical protein